MNAILGFTQLLQMESPGKLDSRQMENLNRILQARLDGVLGVEFLSGRRTIINYKKKKLYFLEWE